MTTLHLPTLNWRKQLRLGFDRLVEQRWINVGLRGKMGAIVVIGLAGLLAIFALLGISTTRQTTSQALAERLVLARTSAANLDATLSHMKSMLTLVADQEVLRQPTASPAMQTAALQAGFDQIAVFSKGVYLLDLAGRPLVSMADQPEKIDWPGIMTAPTGLNGQPFSLTKVPGDQPWVIVAVPVIGKAGTPIAFLAALMDLSDPDVAPFIHPLDLGPTGMLDVVDARGKTLISSHPEQATLNPNQATLLNELLAGGQPTVETCVGCAADNLEARDEIMAFAPLSQAPWGVVIRQEADEVFAPVRRLTLQTVILGLVAVLGALGLVWVTTNSVVAPVQLLTNAAMRIAAGDLATPVCCRRGDEIGDLAQSFDAMRVQLKHSMDEIQTWNRELDERVRERAQAALTAQHEAQRARDDLRAIIDGLSDELVVLGLDFRIEQVNRAAQCRCPPGEDLVGTYCYQHLHTGQPCQPPECECPVARVLEMGEAVKVTHVHRDGDAGRQRYIDIVASPMRDASGRITRVIELMRDVTEEKQMETSLVRRNQELSIMNAVATTVNQSLDLEDILGKTLDELLRLTDIDVGAIFLLKDRLGNLELWAHKGFSEEAARLAARLGLLDGSCGGVVETGQIVVIPDLARYSGRRAESLKRENLQTLVHVPLVARGCTLGSMCVATRSRHEFGVEEQELLTALGNQIAVAVENSRLYAEVQRKEQMRGELLKKVITVQEDERKRIARELHDDTSQNLTALLYAAEEAMDMNDLAEIKDRLVTMRNLAGHSLENVHKLIFDLRPTMLDHLGLVPALRWFAQSRLEPLNLRVTIDETATGRRLPAEVETALFRVVQEAISNIARHSGARNARIAFDLQDDYACVVVEDDGLGFDMVEVTLSPDSRRGLGLMGMRERVELLGGEMEIITAPGYGTQLKLSVPLNGQGAYG